MSEPKCDICGGEYQALTGQTVHFDKVFSGVDNIYLENMTVEQCQQCGASSPYFPTSEEFFHTIARAVVLQPTMLSGGAIKLLRKKCGLKAKEFAAILKIDPATLSRWEKDEQPRSTSNDILIRLAYVQLYNEKESTLFPEKVIERISSVGEIGSSLLIYVNTAKPMTYRYERVKESVAS